MSRSVAIAIFVLTCLLAGNAYAADEKPKVVCESDASGANMICRDVWLGEDAAPFRRVAPAASTPIGAEPTAPLPILAPMPARETSATQAPAYLRKADASPRVEPALPVASSPAIAERAPSSSTTKPTAVAAKPIPTPSPPPAVVAERQAVPPPAPVTTTSAPSVVDAGPTDVIEQPLAATAAAPPPPKPAAATPRAEPIVAATPSTPVETPAPATRELPAAVALLDGTAFRALDGSHYTLELANAKSPELLRELAARLQLAGAVYLIHLRSPESDRWLLIWADHAAQSEARSARQLVPADAAINSGWPRRIAPLQNELVSP